MGVFAFVLVWRSSRTLAGLICEITGGLDRIPSRSYKAQFAKKWIAAGKNADEVIKLTGISRRGFYYLKKRLRTGRRFSRSACS